MPLYKNGKLCKDEYYVICDKCGLESLRGPSSQCSFPDGGCSVYHLDQAVTPPKQLTLCGHCGMLAMSEVMRKMFANAPDPLAAKPVNATNAALLKEMLGDEKEE